MSRPTVAELTRLGIVAGEIMDSLEAHGYLVGSATALHPAFRVGRLPAGALERALVKDAARRGAVKAGMYAEDVVGGLELVSFDETTERRYRVKAATYRDGEPHIVCGVSSTLLSNPQEPGMMPIERWVLCFRTDDDATVTEIFAAEIVGHEGDGPVRLILGPPVALDPISPSDGFRPDDDDDLGVDFDDEAGSGEGIA